MALYISVYLYVCGGDYFHDQRVKLRIANVGNGRQTCVPLESTKISAERGKVNKLSWHMRQPPSKIPVLKD